MELSLEVDEKLKGTLDYFIQAAHNILVIEAKNGDLIETTPWSRVSGGGMVMAGSVLIVFTLVQMVEGYLLTPKIMGEQTGLHPMAIMVAIFFWGTALNGIMGMLLAIPLTAFFVVFWRLARDKYITGLV